MDKSFGADCYPTTHKSKHHIVLQKCLPSLYIKQRASKIRWKVKPSSTGIRKRWYCSPTLLICIEITCRQTVSYPSWICLTGQPCLSLLYLISTISLKEASVLSPWELKSLFLIQSDAFLALLKERKLLLWLPATRSWEHASYWREGTKWMAFLWKPRQPPRLCHTGCCYWDTNGINKDR